MHVHIAIRELQLVALVSALDVVRLGMDTYESVAHQDVPPHCPKSGFKHVFKWTEEKKKEDWRADGYRWRQSGCCKPSQQLKLTKKYFHVSQKYYNL